MIPVIPKTDPDDLHCAMRFLLLGAGKTGSLVAEVASERHHEVELVRSAENPRASALTAERLRQVHAVIDFTTPGAVFDNIAACVTARDRKSTRLNSSHSELSRMPSSA